MNFREWQEIYSKWGYTDHEIMRLGNSLGRDDQYRNETGDTICLQVTVNMMCYAHERPTHESWLYEFAPKAWELC